MNGKEYPPTLIPVNNLEYRSSEFLAILLTTWDFNTRVIELTWNKDEIDPLPTILPFIEGTCEC